MDAVKLLFFFGVCLLGPFAYFGLWWWFWFWTAVGVLLAVVELASFLLTGRTISQQFWKWTSENPKAKKGKWIIITGMVLFWGYLICHLLLKW